VCEIGTGHGFSAKPASTGWDPLRIARAWIELMKRLGYTDSPIGLAAWMLDHDPKSYQLIARAFAGNPGGLSRDDVLDNVTPGFLRLSSTGKQVRILHRPGRQDSGWGQRLSGRALRSATPYHRTMIMAVPEFAAFSSDTRRLGAMSGANGSPLRLCGPRGHCLIRD